MGKDIETFQIEQDSTEKQSSEPKKKGSTFLILFFVIIGCLFSLLKLAGNAVVKKPDKPDVITQINATLPKQINQNLTLRNVSIDKEDNFLSFSYELFGLSDDINVDDYINIIGEQMLVKLKGSVLGGYNLEKLSGVKLMFRDTTNGGRYEIKMTSEEVLSLNGINEVESAETANESSGQE